MTIIHYDHEKKQVASMKIWGGYMTNDTTQMIMGKKTKIKSNMR